MREAKGDFDINLDVVKNDLPPAGRMLITKHYRGALEGQGLGQMISKRADSGVAVYAAIEEFSGQLEGKTGTFSLIHSGYMDASQQDLSIQIIEGSGTEALTGIRGELSIIQEGDKHGYLLEYEL